MKGDRARPSVGRGLLIAEPQPCNKLKQIAEKFSARVFAQEIVDFSGVFVELTGTRRG